MKCLETVLIFLFYLREKVYEAAGCFIIQREVPDCLVTIQQLRPSFKNLSPLFCYFSSSSTSQSPHILNQAIMIGTGRKQKENCKLIVKESQSDINELCLYINIFNVVDMSPPPPPTPYRVHCLTRLGTSPSYRNMWSTKCLVFLYLLQIQNIPHQLSPAWCEQ